MRRPSIRTEMHDEMSRGLNELKKYPVGSEEYERGTRSICNLANGVKNEKEAQEIDPNVMIPGLISAGMLIGSFWLSSNSIVDTRWYSLVKNLFKKF